MPAISEATVLAADHEPDDVAMPGAPKACANPLASLMKKLGFLRVERAQTLVLTDPLQLDRFGDDAGHRRAVSQFFDAAMKIRGAV